MERPGPFRRYWRARWGPRGSVRRGRRPASLGDERAPAGPPAV